MAAGRKLGENDGRDGLEHAQFSTATSPCGTNQRNEITGLLTIRRSFGAEAAWAVNLL